MLPGLVAASNPRRDGTCLVVVAAVNFSIAANEITNPIDARKGVAAPGPAVGSGGMRSRVFDIDAGILDIVASHVAILAARKL